MHGDIIKRTNLKDYDTLEYFFKNIKLFMKHKQEIVCYASLRNIQIEGMKFTHTPLTVGQILSLYNYEGGYRMIDRKNKDVLYICHLLGRSLVGGFTHSIAWSVRKQDFVSAGFKHYKQPTEYPPEKTSKVPKHLKALFAPLLKKQESFLQEEEKSERLARKEEFLKRIECKSINVTDKNGITSLMRYCETNNIKKMTRIWLKNKQAFDATAKDGRTMINFGARNLNALKFLIKKGKTNFTLSPIADACESHIEIKERLDVLLELDADINGKNYLNETPMEVAKDTRNEKAIEWLKEHSAR